MLVIVVVMVGVVLWGSCDDILHDSKVGISDTVDVLMISKQLVQSHVDSMSSLVNCSEQGRTSKMDEVTVVATVTIVVLKIGLKAVVGWIVHFGTGIISHSFNKKAFSAFWVQFGSELLQATVYTHEVNLYIGINPCFSTVMLIDGSGMTGHSI